MTQSAWPAMTIPTAASSTARPKDFRSPRHGDISGFQRPNSPDMSPCRDGVAGIGVALSSRDCGILVADWGYNGRLCNLEGVFESCRRIRPVHSECIA